MSLPYGVKHSEIDALLNLPQKYAVKQELLTAMAMAGETIPADSLLVGIGELLEIAKKEQWRLDENQGEVMDWIELFALIKESEIVTIGGCPYQKFRPTMAVVSNIGLATS